MTDITRKQLAIEIGVPFSWVRDRTAARLIPMQRYGHHIRFTPEQVAAIRKMHQQEPMAVTVRRRGRPS